MAALLDMDIKQKKVNKKICILLNNAKKKFDEFFGINLDIPEVKIIETRSELNTIWGKKTENWFVAGFKNDIIYLLNPLSYKKESSHKQKEFFNILKHELVHFYYFNITQMHYPRWINEGLASYLSGKTIDFSKLNHKNLLNVKEYFRNSEKGVYNIGYFWVFFLIENYGKTKLISLINELDKKDNEKKFEIKFKKIYGFGLSQTELNNELITLKNLNK